MIQLYYYVANGIHISSEFEFPELMPAPENSKVIVQFGQTPKQIDYPIFKGTNSQAGNNQYLLSIKNVASYYLLKAGEIFTITVSPCIGASMSDIRTYILSSMFGALCHMKGLLPLHASGVEIDGKAVLFCGKSGIGKSTLCASLYKKGHAFVTDNLAAIFINQDGIPMVYPSYRHFRLWQDSIDELSEFNNRSFIKRSEIDKYNMIIENQIQQEAIPIYKIYHLNHHDKENISIEPTDGRKKVGIIVNDTFRIKLLKGLGCHKSYFNLLNKLCESTEVSQIYRPSDLFLLDELTEAVIKNVNITSIK